MLRFGTWVGFFWLGLAIKLLGLACPYKINSLAIGLYYTWAFVVVTSYEKISIILIDFVE